MSPARPSHSPDIQRLRDDGYETSITEAGHLVLDHVPYVTQARTVAYGRLISKLTMAGNTTQNPVSDHVVYFVGGQPCDRSGQPLDKIINQAAEFKLEHNLVAQYSCSSKPSDGTPYPDYFAKMTAYVGMLASHAAALDPAATAQTYRVVADPDPESPFVYPDTASTRARITVAADKLRGQRIAIVGLGGTGSYILDLVAKTPVAEIHLFDGDSFLSHNAFRAPGAARLEQLNQRPNKAQHFAEIYANIKHGVIPHPFAVDATNVNELDVMDLVFLSMEGGATKRLIIDRLTGRGVPFVDVGIGVTRAGSSLRGVVSVTTATSTQHEHLARRIDFSDPAPGDIYDENIQIADLNALNATLAVIKWKKLCEFYLDLEREHFAAYTIDGNHLVNDERST
jgi:hypothetical protein